MYKLIRPLLFKLDPEVAHHLTLRLIGLAGIVPPSRWFLQALFAAPYKPVEAFGLTFKNPVGLAAGYDKDCESMRGLAALGFGHLELGTVTPRPQPGNPKPRIFRLLEDEAVINRMGFPGKGAEYAFKSLRKGLGYQPVLDYKKLVQRPDPSPSRKPTPLHRMHSGDTLIGVNLGKNKTTPNEEAVLDYLELLEMFAPLADYLAINVSSPNTVGLRNLQGREALEGLLTQLAHQRQREQEKLEKPVPLLVKLAPDLADAELDDALDVILRTGMDGVIATNTTIERGGLESGWAEEQGGLSGKPLTGRSDAFLKKVVERVDGQVPVVGVGGIMSPDDAKRKLDLGATLIQVYTGMIYAGPGLVKNIVKTL